jgi:hypothetical protein
MFYQKLGRGQERESAHRLNVNRLQIAPKNSGAEGVNIVPSRRRRVADHLATSSGTSSAHRSTPGLQILAKAPGRHPGTAI